jgi:hypothetical protein
MTTDAVSHAQMTHGGGIGLTFQAGGFCFVLVKQCRGLNRGKGRPRRRAERHGPSDAWMRSGSQGGRLFDFSRVPAHSVPHLVPHLLANRGDWGSSRSAACPSRATCRSSRSLQRHVAFPSKHGGSWPPLWRPFSFRGAGIRLTHPHRVHRLCSQRHPRGRARPPKVDSAWPGCESGHVILTVPGANCQTASLV